MKNVTVNVTSATETIIRTMAARTNRTYEEAASELLERGAKDAQYRSERNARQWAQQKVLKERLAELEALVASKQSA